MKKYLYLTKAEWANTWINGGVVPIKLASSYLSQERIGVKTPDENLVDNTPVPLSSLKEFIRIDNDSDIHDFTFAGNVSIGQDGRKRLLPNMYNVSRYREDVLVLCFSNTCSLNLLKKLEKAVCIEIESVNQLKQILDRQLGVVGEARNCDYTIGHQRNHFLKSKEDEWQQEYRICWKSSKEAFVTIPTGFAKHVNFDLC
jgi:hypothetical protein